MADELDGLRRGIETFPATVTAKLRAVAWRKSREVKDIAKRLAARSEGERGRLNRGRPHLADSIVIHEEVDRKQFVVTPETPWNPHLGLWVERGTVKMRARPFMRPAGDQVNASYQKDMLAAATDAATEALK